jgi:hypothetical protein
VFDLGVSRSNRSNAEADTVTRPTAARSFDVGKSRVSSIIELGVYTLMSIIRKPLPIVGLYVVSIIAFVMVLNRFINPVRVS